MEAEISEKVVTINQVGGGVDQERNGNTGDLFQREIYPKMCPWFGGRGRGKGRLECDTWEDWEPAGRRLWKEQKDSRWGLWSLRCWGDFLGALAEEPGPRSEGRPLLSLPNFKFKCGPGASSLPKGKVLRRLFFPHNNAQPLLERAYGWDLGRSCGEPLGVSMEWVLSSGTWDPHRKFLCAALESGRSYL